MNLDLNESDKMQKQNANSIERVKKDEKEYKLVGKLRNKTGLTLFSYNSITNELKPAKIVTNVAMGLHGLPVYKKQTQVEKDCIYFFALNRNNAENKIINKMML